MKFKIKDPGSFLTHFIAMLLSITGLGPLLYRVAQHPSRGRLAAFLIFSLSFILLYGASSAYHFFDVSPRVNRVLKKLDHMMIFVMIAGSYTPVCLVVLGNRTGWLMLLAVCGLSLLGMLMNLLWIGCPRWVSSIIYIALGWVCAFTLAEIARALTAVEFALLLSGGIIYTIGGIIYALKLPLLWKS